MINKLILTIIYLLISGCSSYDSNPPTSSIAGCTDQNANNYSSSTNIDDGSCTYTGTDNHPMNSLWFVSNFDGTWGIGCNSSSSIGGFQFNIDGTTIIGASDGESTANGFGVTTSGSTVISFSMGGGTLPPGEYILTILNLAGTPTGISSIVISDPSGEALDFEYYSEVLGCMDENTCTYNASATEDDGSCSGDCSDECFRNNTACTPNYYLLESIATGVTQLTILVDTIMGLQRGDEIGIFDFNGVLNYNDCSNQIGEILVGSGVWKSEQLEIVSISSVDMCALGGVQLAGYVEGNLVLVKVYRPSTGVEYNTELTWSKGTGNFGDILQLVSEILLSF